FCRVELGTSPAKLRNEFIFQYVAPNRLAVALLQLPFPGQRMADDRVEIVMDGRPAEPRLDPRWIGNDRRRIAGPARRAAHLDGAARHALDRVENLPHREAVPIAA